MVGPLKSTPTFYIKSGKQPGAKSFEDRGDVISSLSAGQDRRSRVFKY